MSPIGDAPAEMGSSLAVANVGSTHWAVKLAAGSYHVCAIREDNSVVCWGSNAYGQLGRGQPPVTVAAVGDQAGEMGDALIPVTFGSGRFAVDLAAGGTHTCALLDNATVKCWGDGIAGQLGQGSVGSLGVAPNDIANANPVNLGAGRTAVSIAAGYTYSCAVLDNGAIKCWGWTAQGRTGMPVDNNNLAIGDTPTEMTNLPAVVMPSWF